MKMQIDVDRDQVEKIVVDYFKAFIFAGKPFRVTRVAWPYSISTVYLTDEPETPEADLPPRNVLAPIPDVPKENPL